MTQHALPVAGSPADAANPVFGVRSAAARGVSGPAGRELPGGRLPGPGQVLLGIGPQAVEQLRRWADRYPGAAYLRGDRPRFWWELPARASLEWELALRAGRAPQPESLTGHAARVIALLGLENHLDLRPEALCPLDRAALDVALALAGRPRVLLWEEPLHGLEPRERRLLARRVRRACRTLSVGIVAAARSTLSGLRDLTGSPGERRALGAAR